MGKAIILRGKWAGGETDQTAGVRNIRKQNKHCLTAIFLVKLCNISMLSRRPVVRSWPDTITNGLSISVC